MGFFDSRQYLLGRGVPRQNDVEHGALGGSHGLGIVEINGAGSRNYPAETKRQSASDYGAEIPRIGNLVGNQQPGLEGRFAQAFRRNDGNRNNPLGGFHSRDMIEGFLADSVNRQVSGVGEFYNRSYLRFPFGLYRNDERFDSPSRFKKLAYGMDPFDQEQPIFFSIFGVGEGGGFFDFVLSHTLALSAIIP